MTKDITVPLTFVEAAEAANCIRLSNVDVPAKAVLVADSAS